MLNCYTLFTLLYLLTTHNPFGQPTFNKMQKGTADFVPVPPPGELDETYTSSFIRPVVYIAIMKT